jgi:hypothetical protein
MSNKHDVDILVNGKSVKQYTHNGRIFIEAKNGSEYSINIRNNRVERVLAVCTVDGINVLNGEAGASKAGYVINGFSAVEIKGFRTSNEKVTAFAFSDKHSSYASEADVTGGDVSNCGVIGVQIYAEKWKPAPVIKRTIVEEHHHYHEWPRPYIWPKPRPYEVTWTCNSTDSAGLGNLNTYSTSNLGGTLRCASLNNAAVGDNVSANFVGLCQSAPSPTPDFDMGTKWSNHEISDRVHDVEFETGRLLTTFTIYYASRSALERAGVQFHIQTQVSFPEAFPSGFCKPPRR